MRIKLLVFILSISKFIHDNIIYEKNKQINKQSNKTSTKTI